MLRSISAFIRPNAWSRAVSFRWGVGGGQVSAMLAKACALVLEDYPVVNARYEPGQTVYQKDINVAMAVAIDGGLITPTLKASDARNSHFGPRFLGGQCPEPLLLVLRGEPPKRDNRNGFARVAPWMSLHGAEREHEEPAVALEAVEGTRGQGQGEAAQA